ncbi:S8 family serine peptidase [Actinomadura sp. 6K520]|uniref:S8 family serine peptidase n=1 Tax=Actinomadura sp. 6K520 TaxID=2530364 RepID=UPI001404D46A|nr:S8 family serine peptidase [Actinomadura sp. 6K520]
MENPLTDSNALLPKCRRSRVAALLCAGVALAGVASMAAAEGAYAAEDNGDRKFLSSGANGVHGEYLVTLRADLASGQVRRVADELSREHGGRRGHVFETTGTGFAVSMPEQQARKLARDPRVVEVAQDSRVYPLGRQDNAPNHLDRMDERARPLDGKYNVSYNPTEPPGSGQVIYVIDTGVRADHSLLAGRVIAGPDFANDPGSTWYGSDKDCYNHGTGVATLAVGDTYGVARGAKVVSLKVFADCDGLARSGDIYSAVEWVTRNGAPNSVVNMSLGGPVNAGAIVVENAIKKSMAAGFTYVVGAGNNNTDACGASPGRVPEAITVAASNANDQRWYNSNYGSCVDMYAVAENVTTASSGSAAATLTTSGTSFAAPQVAGATAHHASRGNLAVSNVPRVKFEATRNVLTGEPNVNANNLLHFGGYYANRTNVPVPDVGGAGSVITVTDRNDPGSAMTTYLRVSLSIDHSKRGQLNVDLFAPNGRSWRLHSPSSDTGDDVVRVDVPVNAADVPPNGQWTLRVDDKKSGAAGTITGWSLQF